MKHGVSAALRVAVILVIVMAFSGAFAAPQVAPDNSADAANLTRHLRWRSIGPGNMVGRISDFEALESDFSQVLVATASGGVFKSVNAGTTWEPIFDNGGSDVIGERIVLVGTAPVPLQRRNVIASTVVVSNLTRTQTYVEGLDYLLTVVGDVTRIQRLAGGNIFVGQEVLVDYSFQTQGTFSFTTWAHNVSATLRVMRYYELYACYRNISNSVKTGTPNFPLNDVNDWVFGARADVPLKWDIVVGGYAELGNDDETIAPFTRQSYNAYVEAPLPFGISSGLRVGAVYEARKAEVAS